MRCERPAEHRRLRVGGDEAISDLVQIKRARYATPCALPASECVGRRKSSSCCFDQSNWNERQVAKNRLICFARRPTLRALEIGDLSLES
jgi:hypothetical protein